MPIPSKAASPVLIGDDAYERSRRPSASQVAEIANLHLPDANLREYLLEQFRLHKKEHKQFCMDSRGRLITEGYALKIRMVQYILEGIWCLVERDYSCLHHGQTDYGTELFIAVVSAKVDTAKELRTELAITQSIWDIKGNSFLP